METKIKILKILPFWLIALSLVITLQVAASLLREPKTLAADETPASRVPAVPEVLGASTPIRGDAVPTNTPITQINQPDFSGISAKSFLVFDLASGQDLLQKNADEKLDIASLTKLMTGLVAYQFTDLNKTFTITDKDTLAVAPALGLLPGDQIKALDIFNAMLIGSNNDAALALADFTNRETNEDFILLMNSKAESLGMKNSNFSNPMGFDSQYNYSTAWDLKILITETEKLPAFTDLGRRTSYEFSGSEKTYSTTATNKLLTNHPDIEAIKTGATPGAGEAMATKVTIGSHEVVIIVLGSADREADTLKLKEEISNDFNWN